MKTKFPYLFLLISVAFFFACGQRDESKDKSESAVKKFSPAAWFAKDTIGIFREAEFGDEPEVIRILESEDFLVFSDAHLLKYDYPLPGDRHYELSFMFRKKKLNSFTFDAYLSEEREGEELTEDFKKYFTSRFGPHQSKMGILVWRVPAPPEFREAFLELKDESPEYGYGKVNISAYAIRK